MTEIAERIATRLIEMGQAARMPLARVRCRSTVELRDIGCSQGNRWFVKRNGEIRVGPTLRESTPVGPQFRALITGGYGDGGGYGDEGGKHSEHA